MSKQYEEVPLVEKDPSAPAKQYGWKRYLGLFGPEYPFGVRFIIGNEFCERFSYYGARAILGLYLKTYFGYDDDRSTTIVHAFIFAAYFFPLLGGVLADSYLGKFKTIFYLSIVYCLGNIVMAVTAIPGVTGNPPLPWGVAVGLFLVAVGTGGIKPCVSSFGGDQFKAHQIHLLSTYFSIFYASINAGSVLSMIITPILRSDVQCFGRDDCFPLAYGVPAVLMIIALIVFLIGSKSYTRVPLTPNVFFRSIRAVGVALRRRCQGYRAEHWLDNAEGVYDKELIEGTKAVLRVLVLFLPLPVFWALFDQQSSRWTFQAQRMNGHGVVRADQMQAVNAILILVFIPIFEKGIYPLLRKCRCNLTPLRKMTAGMIFAGLAFVGAALVEMNVNKTCCYPLTSKQLEELAKEPTIPVNGCTMDQCQSMFMQVPMYALLTAGEVMFSITGLEFAYSQAPASMKSMLTSCWLLTVAFGNVLVAIIAESHLLPDQVWEFVLFAALIGVMAFIFSLLAWRYKYVNVVDNIAKDQPVARDVVSLQTVDDEQSHGLPPYRNYGKKPDA